MHQQNLLKTMNLPPLSNNQNTSIELLKLNWNSSFEHSINLEHESIELALETLNIPRIQYNSMTITDLNGPQFYNSNSRALNILLYYKKRSASSVPF